MKNFQTQEGRHMILRHPFASHASAFSLRSVIFFGPGRASAMRLTLTLSIGLLLLCYPSPTRAQSTFGTITGTVTDQTGAVVPGATVTVTNEGTRIQRTVTSTGTGVY